MRMKIVSFIKLEGIFSKYEPKHFFQKSGRYRRVVLVENFLCVEYNCYAFLLWYIGVDTCDIHRDKKYVFKDFIPLYEVYELCRTFKIPFLYFCYWLK